MKSLATLILVRIIPFLFPLGALGQAGNTYCTNTALVPVFKQDFGQSPNSTSSTIAPPNSTNYNYGNVGTDGNYIVTPRLENANKSDWTKGGDHTGNLNGNFFLVNAGGGKNIFLQQTVTGLCPGSNYSFSAWLANVNTADTKNICGAGIIYPKITFNVKDTFNVIIATYTTDILPLSPINGPINWMKYGFQFSLPSYTGALKIEIIDFWGGGPACGNDVALDDIVFEACVPLITIALTTSSNNICLGDSAKMLSSLINSPYISPAYLWQQSLNSGASWNDLDTAKVGKNQFEIYNAIPANGGLYRVLVGPTINNIKNPTCGAISNGVAFSVNLLPKVNPTTNAPICSGNDLLIKSNATGGAGAFAKYIWTGPAPFQLLNADTILTAVQTFRSGLYTVKVIDTNGCKDSSQILVQIDSTPIIKVIAITDTICSGAIASIKTESSLANNQFFWSSTPINGSAISNTAFANPNLSGIYSSTIINNSTLNAKIKYSIYSKSVTNCISKTIDTNIIIRSILSIANAGNDINLCSGTQATLNATTPVVGKGVWKQISGPNTAKLIDSLNASSTVDSLIAGSYLFSWIVSNSCGSSSDTVLIKYTTKPQPIFSISDSVACGPVKLFFTNNTTNKNQYSYFWNFGNGSSSVLADPTSVLFNSSSTGLDTTYTIRLSAFSNCDTIYFSKLITLKGKPKTVLTITPNNNCFPVRVEFTNQSIGSNSTFKLLFGNGVDSIINNNSTIQYTYQSAINKNYQPILIIQNVCGIDSIVGNVFGLANLSNVQHGLIDTAICGLPFIYTINNKTIGASQFTWNWGDGSTNNTATNNGTLLHTYQSAGSYTITHTITHQCGDTTITKSIKVFPSVKATIQALPNEQCIGDSILFKTIGDTTSLYQWKINDSTYNNILQFSKPFSKEGIYNVQLLVSKINIGLTCVDSNYQQFKIVAIQQGKANISPLSGNCIPFEVQLINQSKKSNTVIWDMGDGNNLAGDTVKYLFNKPGNFKIKMTALSAGGCIYIDSSSVQIKSPIGSIQFKGGLYCNSNNLVSFNPTVSNTDSIEYNFGDGTIITSTINLIKHQYLKSGIYYPTFTLISSAGCRILLPQKDSVIVEKVKAYFKVSTIYNCGITSFTFTDSSESLKGINQFAWQLNKNYIGLNKTATADFKQTGTHETNLIVTSNYGCIDSIKATFKVIIFSFPQVNIKSINEACLNNLMELKSEINSIDSIIYRVWNLGNGNKAGDSTIRILYFDEGKYIVQLTAATINKCYDSALKQITIHPIPIIKLAITNNLCNGDSIILKADGATNYVWKDQQENIICNNCLTVKVKPQKNTQYKVIGYNEFGCTEIAATNVQVINKQSITVSPESVICEGSSVRIYAIGGSTYQWLPANGLNTNNVAAPIVSPTITTTYKVIGKDAFNCFADTGYVKVVVGKPTPIKIGKDSSFVAGTSIKLQALPQSNNIIKWRWSGGANLSCVACPDPIARVVNDETIVLTVTNNFGCISSDTIRFKTFCPNTEVFIPNAFTPDGDGINDVLYVQSRGIKLVKSMRIYNRWGEVVFEKNNFNPNDINAGWNGRIKGNLANPDIYVYICEVVCEKGAIQLLKGNVAVLK